MDSTLLTILVKDIALPEILAVLHRTVHDDASILIKLSKDVAEIKAQGQAFLDATAPRP